MTIKTQPKSNIRWQLKTANRKDDRLRLMVVRAGLRAGVVRNPAKRG